MKKATPKAFLDEFESKRDQFENALKQITSLLQLRLGQLNARKGIRARITDARVKRPVKLWRNARRANLSVSEAFARVEDLLGVRIVCNNLSDIDPLVEMIRTECPRLNVLEIKNMVSSPSRAGYRATHVRTEYGHIITPDKVPIPCEIQIRTLAQDVWARLSRADLYQNDIPPSLQKLSQALSTQLSAIDEIAQLIRDELHQCPDKAETIKDSDPISPQRLALVYRGQFGKEIYEWRLVDWVQTLEEAEIERIGEVRALLNDPDIRKRLDILSNRIRGFPLEDDEWVVYSALVSTEATTAAGVKAVKKRIQEGWDEIVATARGEILSEMPDTIEEFVEMLRSRYFPTEAIRELGGIQDCSYCHTDILNPGYAAEAVLDFYGNPELAVDLESLFEGATGEDVPEVESIEYSGACSYCSHRMSKDD